MPGMGILPLSVCFDCDRVVVVIILDLGCIWYVPVLTVVVYSMTMGALVLPVLALSLLTLVCIVVSMVGLNCNRTFRIGNRGVKSCFLYTDDDDALVFVAMVSISNCTLSIVLINCS
jgi:hypothetical protein